MGDLTSNFSWRETYSRGVRPSKQYEFNILRVAVVIQTIRAILGLALIVTTWYRTPIHNASVGGVTKSYHLSGEAVDLVANGMTSTQLYMFIIAMIDMGLIPDGELLDEKDHVHYAPGRGSKDD